MNTKEKMAVQPTNEFVAEMLKKRNKGTEDCTLTSLEKKLNIKK